MTQTRADERIEYLDHKVSHQDYFADWNPDIRNIVHRCATHLFPLFEARSPFYFLLAELRSAVIVAEGTRIESPATVAVCDVEAACI
jgi:hypothetical protein